MGGRKKEKGEEGEREREREREMSCLCCCCSKDFVFAGRRLVCGFVVAERRIFFVSE
jgi:hypothetical protein